MMHTLSLVDLLIEIDNDKYSNIMLLLPHHLLIEDSGVPLKLYTKEKSPMSIQP